MHRRAERLADLAWRAERARIDRILCAEERIDPEAFAADCAQWERRFKVAGATTRRAQAALIAQNLGITTEEVLADAELIATRALALWAAER